MQSSTPASTYYHPRLIQLIQQRQPEYDDALDAVQDAQNASARHEAGTDAGRTAAGTGTGTAAADHPSSTGALAAGSAVAGDAVCLLAPLVVG